MIRGEFSDETSPLLHVCQLSSNSLPEKVATTRTDDGHE